MAGRLFLTLAAAAAMVGLSCSSLWDGTLELNPRNCVSNPSACGHNERCDAVTELCTPFPLRLDTVSPSQASRIGGTVLTLGGEGFVPGMAIELAGMQIPADQITIQSPQSLSIRTPPGGSLCGLVPITLSRPGGDRVTRADLFRYAVRAPQFTSSFGVKAGSTAVLVSWIDTSDLNHDGNTDIIAAVTAGANATLSTVATLLGRGDGSFETFKGLTTGQELFSFAVTDWDRDGNPDVLGASQTGEVQWLRGQGDGTLVVRLPHANPKVGALTAIVPLALGPGQPSTAIAIGNSLSRLQYRDGTSITLQGPSSEPAGQVAVSGDFDRDGHTDVLRAYYNLERAPDIYFGAGDGTFVPGGAVPLPGAFVGVDVGDLNGDGLLDVALSSPYSSSVAILLNQESGVYAAPRLLAGTRSRLSKLADLDCDGDLDVVVVGEGYDRASYFLNSGDGQFGNPNTIQLPAGGFSLAVADLNRDGLPDLIFGMMGTTDVRVALNSAR